MGHRLGREGQAGEAGGRNSGAGVWGERCTLSARRDLGRCPARCGAYANRQLPGPAYGMAAWDSIG